jgi:dimethylsulfone monooxygenase
LQGKLLHKGKACGKTQIFEDLVQYNDGFKTGLIGTAEQVADKIIELKKIGVDIVLTGFLHYDEELRSFGEIIIPLVKQKEKQLDNVGAQNYFA